MRIREKISMARVNLQLLKSVTMPAPTSEWAQRCTFDAALTRVVAIPAGVDAVLVGEIGNANAPDMKFSVPPDATIIAMSLKRRYLAVVNSKSILYLRDENGAVIRT